MRVVGPKQQKILDLLAERGALCLATVLAETSPNPAGRGLVQQAIRRLCDSGLVVMEDKRDSHDMAALVALAPEARDRDEIG